MPLGIGVREGEGEKGRKSRSFDRSHFGFVRVIIPEPNEDASLYNRKARKRWKIRQRPWRSYES
jgi:hypothetical protein